MRLYWSPQGQGPLWVLPALLGVALIGLGLLLFVWPELVAYFIAAVFIVAGMSVLGMAWRMRQQVTFQRIDRQWQVREDDGAPGPGERW